MIDYKYGAFVIKILSLFLSFLSLIEQGLFAQTIDLSHYLANPAKPVPQSDKFRPLHLRYLSYDRQANDFNLLLDKGDFLKGLSQRTVPDQRLEEATQELMKYFFIGLALPNEKFWVNLRPDSPDNILDPDLEKTDIGRIFLEADLQLKKDTASFTSPQNPEGKAYWDKLYKKAEELFQTRIGTGFTIPTITRPWIVPGEIIIGEAADSAYIYKATLKVMLEEDYLTSRGDRPFAPTSQQYAFNDPRLKDLNQYSTQLIKETILPKLTYEVNTSKRYAPLRQVYYSLILAQWFKQKYGRFRSTRTQEHKPEQENPYIKLIDSGDLTNLAAKETYDKQSYFQQYQKSFKDGEYNLQEPVHTPAGQSIRRYVSGGIGPLDCSSAINAGKVNIANRDIRRQYLTVSHIKDKTTTLSSPLRSHSSRSAIKAALRVMRGFTFPESNIPSDGILNIPYSVISTEANNVPESIDLILKLKICSGREYKNFHFYDMRSFKDTRFRNAIYIRDITTVRL